MEGNELEKSGREGNGRDGLFATRKRSLGFVGILCDFLSWAAAIACTPASQWHPFPTDRATRFRDCHHMRAASGGQRLCGGRRDFVGKSEKEKRVTPSPSLLPFAQSPHSSFLDHCFLDRTPQKPGDWPCSSKSNPQNWSAEFPRTTDQPSDFFGFSGFLRIVQFLWISCGGTRLWENATFEQQLTIEHASTHAQIISLISPLFL
jgi:hypothetical protein